MSNIDFTEYDRITDTLMYLSDNLTLNFTVGLSRKGKSGDRIFYQYETRYGSDKYGSPLRSVKRQMNFAFVIDCKDDFSAGIMLRPQDVELLTRIIDQKVIPWFIDPNSSVFKIIDDEIIISEYTPTSFIQSDRWISFEPAVYTDPFANDMQTRGIKIELYSGYGCILSVDKFMGFYHLLAHTDMYGIACNMCNYVKAEPYGINIFSSQGLGASPNHINNAVHDAYSNNAGAGFRKNSFLDNAKSKERKTL